MSIAQLNKLREVCLSSIVELIKLPYVKLLHKHRVPWKVTEKELSNFPAHCLGHHLYQFLSTNNLSIQALYESHNVYHLISGYSIGLINEARLFFFLLGNGKRSLSVLGSVLVALIIYPDCWPTFKKEYRHGKNFKPIFEMDFEKELCCDFYVLKESLRR